MAGILKPDRVGREVKILTSGMLVNGELDTVSYGNAVFMAKGFGPKGIDFAVEERCNIWAITGIRPYGVDTNGSVVLYKTEGENKILIGTYPTVDKSIGRDYGKWYKLFSDLSSGSYRMERIFSGSKEQVGFQELYGEVYGVKSRVYVQLAGEVFGMKNEELS